MKIINQVMKTNDYTIFSQIKGNRFINKSHLNRIKQSIKEEYLEVPIIVNEKYEIIDGQHRFEAVKELKKEIYFIKVKGLELDQVRRLNTNTKGWNCENYMNSYCELGYPDYIQYKDFKKKYGFNHNETMAILSLDTRMSGAVNVKFKDGLFQIVNLKKSMQLAEKIIVMKKYYEGYKRRSFVYAMLDLFDNPEYNHQEFIKKLSYQTTKLVDVPRAEYYLQIIEKIYNYNRPKKEKVRFY